MKFVLREKGIEEFRRLVAEKRKQITTPAETFFLPTPVRAPLVTLDTFQSGGGASAEYQRWAQHNLQPQRQPGYGVVWIKLPAGTVFSHQLRGLANLLQSNGLSAVRISVSQDLVIPWTPIPKARAVFRDLSALDLATPGARTIADVTGCPGATTCNLGITRSLTLADVLAKEFEDETDPEVLKVRIKISGCPNSCGQHHIADIGLYGNARKIGERQAPYYQLMLGGEVSANGVRFARQVVPVAAKRIPEALRALLQFYRQNRDPYESFRSWVQRISDEEVTRCLAPFIDTSTEVGDLFIDWGDRETYSLKLGRGECAT
jgi:sulfite reductase beta subunit-like hemoprotein